MFRLIKYLYVNLTQIPAKCLVMEIVVADVPPKYGMLLSRSWGAKLQGTMQMDMIYTTIPVFNQNRRIYRESHMKYTVTSQDKPQNSPMYYVNTGLDYFIMFNEETLGEQVTLIGLMVDREEEANTTELPKQFVEPLSIIKLNKGLKLQVMHPLLLNIKSQESGPQPSNISEEMKHIDRKSVV